MNDQQLQHLMNAAQDDEIYLELQALLHHYEPDFRRIMNTLSNEDRYRLHMYVAAREGIESRLVRIAYFLTAKQ